MRPALFKGSVGGGAPQQRRQHRGAPGDEQPVRRAFPDILDPVVPIVPFRNAAPPGRLAAADGPRPDSILATERILGARGRFEPTRPADTPAGPFSQTLPSPMPPAQPPADAWRRALSGDRDAFEDALAPYQDDLRTAANRLLDVQRDPVDDTPEDDTGTRTDLTPDELVGETLVRAWDLRDRYDANAMSFRSWLLGIESRSLARLARADQRYAERKVISLDEEIPTGEDQDAVEEDFYEFRQPFDVDTYEEIIADTTPEDPEIDGYQDATLSQEDRDLLADATFPDAVHHATILHDEFEVPLPEVAQIIDASLKETAAMMNLARAGLLARFGSTDDEHDDDPATDSYTGDPLPDA